MMKNLLNNRECVEALNKYTAEKNDVHLFLLCNYDPEAVSVYSPDAIFLRSVLNLYKLLKDSTCILLRTRECQVVRMVFDPGQERALLDIVRQAEYMRGFIAHSNPQHGYKDEWFKQWLTGAIGQDSFTQMEDYDKAILVINKYACQLEGLLRIFVDQLACSAERNAIIARWKESVFSWYGSNDEIFRHQLQRLYLARNRETRPGLFPSFYSLCGWLKAWYYQDINSKRVFVEELREKSNEPEGTWSQVMDDIRQKEAELQQKVCDSIGSKKSVPELSDYYSYFKSQLPVSLKSYYEANPCSLEPEELLASYLDEELSPVPLV